MGKALYRKYRPISLDTVVGQDSVTKPLRKAIETGSFSHAYIFTGPRGCGKTSVARIFAHEINGFKYELEDSYIDIIEIDGASNTGIDDIRNLREKAMIAPTEGKYKVYIIDEFHMLSKSAFNALLKIMEEPPEHVIFLLATTNLEKVPVTILSRAQVFEFNLADPDLMFEHLKQISEKENIKISPDALKIIVRRGGGSFRDSLSLLDQLSNLKDHGEEITAEDIESALGLPEDKKIAELLDLFEKGENATKALKDLLNSGKSAETLASTIIEKILEKPTGKTLNLIKKLFNVQPPFADAKLLVAFLESGKYQVPTTGQVVLATSQPVTNPKVSTKKAELIKRVEDSRRKAKKRDEEIQTMKSPEDLETASLNDSIIQGGKLNLEAFVRDIKTIHRGIGNALERSYFILNHEEKELKIYPPKSLIAVFKQTNNNKLLRDNAPGYSIIIIDTKEEKVPKTAIAIKTEVADALKVSEKMQKEIDAVSDIMGEGQVKEVDNAPF
ncbi:DNA polymerase III subunit gamma/tau [Candidatus Saccharibacteria bacterium]|nr:DNA polymerase III subunit gamma/tau [Candidatus Saccharibacteria bacterium]